MGTEKSTLAIEIGRRIAERRKQLGLKMLEPLDERQFLEIQNIIRDILKFGGCPPEI